MFSLNRIESRGNDPRRTNYRGARTQSELKQGEHVIQANGPDTTATEVYMYSKKNVYSF